MERELVSDPSVPSAIFLLQPEPQFMRAGSHSSDKPADVTFIMAIKQAAVAHAQVT